MKNSAVALVLFAFIAGFSCKSEPTSPTIPDNISDVPRVTVRDLKARLDGGEAIIIVDVRSKESYDQEHIPGAIHIPYADTGSRLAEFPKDRDIVFYCT